MAFAPKGLKVGESFELDGKKYRVKKTIVANCYEGYETEPVEDEEDDLSTLPFAPIDEEEPAPKKTTRRRAAK